MERPTSRIESLRLLKCSNAGEKYNVEKGRPETSGPGLGSGKNILKRGRPANKHGSTLYLSSDFRLMHVIGPVK